MKRILIIFSLIIFGNNLAEAGGPWVKNKGALYLKLSEWWTIFDQHYTDNGQIDPNVTTGIFNTNLYAEYGLTDRFTVNLNATLLSRNYMNNLRSATTKELIVQGEGISTFGDVDLSFKYGITKPGNATPIAISVLLGFPTGTESAGALNNLQTGDGEFNQLLRLDLGRSFSIGSKSAYVALYGGFNNRTNDFSDELRFGLETGVSLADKLWVIGRLDNLTSLKNGKTAETITSTSIFANNAEYLSMGLELSYAIKKNFGVAVSAAGALSGSIIAAAPSYSFGFYFDL